MITENNLKPFAVRLLEKRFSGFAEGYRQNVALLGSDQNELFTVLDRCLAQSRNPEIIFLSLNSTYLDSKDFLKAAAGSILSQHLNRYEQFDILLNHATAALPATAGRIKKALAQKKISFLDVLETINSFINESGKKCVFLLEDFTSLSNIFTEFHQAFAQFIILQQNCMVVLVSSQLRKAEKILGNQFNFLFGNFETISLDDCSLCDNYRYFLELLAPLKPPADFTAFLINILQGNTTYYRIITPEIKYEFSENWTETLLNILQRTLYEKNAALYRTFLSRIELLRAGHRDYRVLIKLLFLMSQGYTRKSDLRFFTGLDSRQFSIKMQSLLENGYVRQMGNIYILSDSLFSFWLETVFKPYTMSCLPDKQARCRQFREKVKEKISLFNEEFCKETTQRIFELFSSFKNDTVLIEKQKIKFPALQKIKLISYPEKNMDLLVGEGEEIVFAAIKQDTATENDIIDFIEKTNSIKVKSLKKIFISLGELTAPAKFIAKESKIAVWDMHGLNNVLRLYSKPILL